MQLMLDSSTCGITAAFWDTPSGSRSAESTRFQSPEPSAHIESSSQEVINRQGRVSIGTRCVPDSYGGHLSEPLGQVAPSKNGVQKHITRPRTATQPLQRKDTDKLFNAQRARKVTDYRHRKLKRFKSANDQHNVNEKSEVAREGIRRLLLHREKNRIAAAKYRAKRSAMKDRIEEEARTKAGANAFLIQRVRGLMDEKSRLRSLILEHNPRICGCLNIHHFNHSEAERLVPGLRS